MSKIEINKLTNANVYMNGINLLGRAEEVQLPQIKHKMAEHKALGMVGSAEFFAGIDKMECKIKWNALYSSAHFLFQKICHILPNSFMYIYMFR